MAETAEAQDIPAKKSMKLPLIIGFILALIGGGAGFYATFSGMLHGSAPVQSGLSPEALPDIGFVPIDPILISLGASGQSRHLRFSAQLEVAKAHVADTQMLMPRVLDVLNGYLRAVEISDLENPASLMKLRAQMLRRVQMVTGEGRVRDFLITEFVLN